MTAGPAFCLAEDRGAEEIGLRLAVASVAAAAPGARVYVYRPAATPDFSRWLAGIPGATLCGDLPAGAYSWNCKPHVLLPLLERGEPEVIWLDSDVILARDPRPLFRGRPAAELTTAAEPPTAPTPPGTAVRTAGWGLPPGRDHPATLNTCVLRVTPAHAPLLRRWKGLLGTEEYRQIQARPIPERPVHATSDQDVLNALLGSAEFAHVPVRTLRGGVDLIHCGGALTYPLGERLRGLFRRTPPFLHSPAAKPWYVFAPAGRPRGWFWFQRRLLQEVSPYYRDAHRLRAAVEADCPWLGAASAFGLLLRAAGFGHFALRGLPLTAAATAAVAAKRTFRGRR